MHLAHYDTFPTESLVWHQSDYGRVIQPKSSRDSVLHVCRCPNTPECNDWITWLNFWEINLTYVCWSREISKTCRLAAIENWLWTPWAMGNLQKIPIIKTWNNVHMVLVMAMSLNHVEAPWCMLEVRDRSIERRYFYFPKLFLPI